MHLRNTPPPILGVIRDGKELATLLMSICNTELWNAYDGVIGVFTRESQSFQYQRLKFKSGINREFQGSMEFRLLVRKLLGEFGVF